MGAGFCSGPVLMRMDFPRNKDDVTIALQTASHYAYTPTVCSRGQSEHSHRSRLWRVTEKSDLSYNGDLPLQFWRGAVSGGFCACFAN